VVSAGPEETAVVDSKGEEEPTIVIRTSEAEDGEAPEGQGPSTISNREITLVSQARPEPQTLSPKLQQALVQARELFRIRDLRPGQAEIVESVLAGRDTLAIMPTGSGKSLT
jgi:superfamily II DNA helicase RecQ